MAQTWSGINNLLISKAMENGIPLTGSFELTPRCNLHCKMCYICCYPNDKSAIAAELTAATWIRLGREAREAGLFFLTLTGGEIFLRNDFQEIYEAYTSMGFNITLFTNASLITKEKARWLGKIPPGKVSVTIYGASPETYGKVTGFPDAYEKTIRGIDALASEGIKLQLKTTVVKANYNEFKTLSQLARTYGTGLGIVNYISPRREGDCTDPEGNRLSPEETAAYEAIAAEYNSSLSAGDSDFNVHIDRDNMAAENVPSIAELRNIEKSKGAFLCSAGRSAFWLSWDGRMMPCGQLDFPAADAMKLGFRKAWEKIKNDCMAVPRCQECISCSIKDYCMTCPARLKAETGRFDIPARYLCETAESRKRIASDLLVHKDRNTGEGGEKYEEVC